METIWPVARGVCYRARIEGAEVLEEDVRDDLGAKGDQRSLDVARQFRGQRQRFQDRSDQAGNQTRCERKTSRRPCGDSRADKNRRLSAADDTAPVHLIDRSGVHDGDRIAVEAIRAGLNDDRKVPKAGRSRFFGPAEALKAVDPGFFMQ